MRLLCTLEEKDTYINLALNKALFRTELSAPERALFTELAYGVIQRQNTLDWVLAMFLTRSLHKLTPWMRNILRMGAYQIIYLKRIPHAAVVDEAVKLAYRYGHKGVAGMVNAVLRKVSIEQDNLPWPVRSDNPIHYLSLYYSFPSWIIERWLNNYGLEETEALCAASNLPPPLTVRTNTLRLCRSQLQLRLEEENVEAKPCQYAPEGLHIKLTGSLMTLNCFREGLFQVQSESSMLIAPLLNPQPGEEVLDMCSSPGGKTVHLAMLMENKGRITAADLYQHRLKLVEEAARRQGAENISLLRVDARFLPAALKEAFDRVLLDVPCSGLGVLRRKGDLKWRRKPEDIKSLGDLQFQLLNRAFFALKPGGVLLYSACTLEPEETCKIINNFMETQPLARLSLFAPLLPDSLKAKEHEEGMFTLWPHRHGLDGFFMARIRKKG